MGTTNRNCAVLSIPNSSIKYCNSFSLWGNGNLITSCDHGIKPHSGYPRAFTYYHFRTYFTALQAYEYIEASFTIADSVYGSTFFVATGFHGLHVIIGTRFLAVCLYRLYSCHFSANHHFGFEAAA